MAGGEVAEVAGGANGSPVFGSHRYALRITRSAARYLTTTSAARREEDRPLGEVHVPPAPLRPRRSGDSGHFSSSVEKKTENTPCCTIILHHPPSSSAKSKDELFTRPSGAALRTQRRYHGGASMWIHRWTPTNAGTQRDPSAPPLNLIGAGLPSGNRANCLAR
ncbi:hypothetical protein EYF80_052803 [Liparis tanakae]|uniref:Uncharacterized protein n=1 Tax=Liparis tanakae TaxID=230148 RepID=A0A4Z2F828_9TELE|nr:hypothetical protein EYF80_052803 [Liparis tanakae]